MFCVAALLCSSLLLHVSPTSRQTAAPTLRRGVARLLLNTPQRRLDALDTLDTVVTRGLDTVEDAWLLARRLQAAPVSAENCLAAWNDEADPRPRLLVLGSGWAAHALVKIVDADLYRLLVISPRNYFIFTPMLAASSVGTVEYRSIAEPMRAANPCAAFIEGAVTDIDPFGRSATVRISADGDEPPSWPRDGRGGDEGGGSGEASGGRSIDLSYDTLVFACGVRASVGSVPGVAEHCYFLKELTDAQRLRRAVGNALELASQPGISEARRRAILTLVVVGGGATGVEYTGELTDFLTDTLSRLYPGLLPYASVRLVHGGDELLPQFDAPLRAQV